MSRSIKVDLVAAFAASLTKAGAYAAISTLLLAGGSKTDDFGMFTLIRSTLGLLNYAILGLAPALIRQLAPAMSHPGTRADAIVTQGPTEHDKPAESLTVGQLYSSAQYPAFFIGAVALGLLLLYTLVFSRIYVVPPSLVHYAAMSALLVGLAMLARLVSDVPGGYLQASHHVALDSMILLVGDLLWPPLTYVLIHYGYAPTTLVAASAAYCICYFGVCLARFVIAWLIGAPIFAPLSAIHGPTARHLLAFGTMLTISQLSDFLYAPTDFILINNLLPAARMPQLLADYSVVAQFDAGFLLLTAAVPTVLYPRASRALAKRDVPLLRKYYFRGTFLMLALLILAAAVLVIIRKPLLLAWLHTEMPGTRIILPLMLVHTIVNGSTAPARAILLAAGKARVFAWSALAAGILNLVISYLLLRYTSLELVGVIIGTLVAVILRCAFFLPWYTLYTLRNLPPSIGQDTPPDDALIEPA
jgi:O-antigen/teichoic acid export membrane protein